jgi:uncharacterized Zn finger protein
VSRRKRRGGNPENLPRRPPPEHGIKVRQIGATWWGMRWIAALEKLSANYQNRLARGRAYARAGRVHDLRIAPGQVTAHVTGSRKTPYKVMLRIAMLDNRAWNRAIAEMSRQALFAAELLAGQMPREIDSAFRAAGRSLFPASERDLKTSCSCPDYANPCKHVAAMHYVLAEAFDMDPFLLFELRGRGRDDVLAALRSIRAGEPPPAPGAAEPSSADATVVSLAGRAPAEFEQRRGAPANFHFRIEPPAAPGAILRQLGPPPGWSLDESLAELLAPLYLAAGALARDLALRPVEEVAAGITPGTPAGRPDGASAPTARGRGARRGRSRGRG